MPRYRSHGVHRNLLAVSAIGILILVVGLVFTATAVVGQPLFSGLTPNTSTFTVQVVNEGYTGYNGQPFWVQGAQLSISAQGTYPADYQKGTSGTQITVPNGNYTFTLLLPNGYVIGGLPANYQAAGGRNWGAANTATQCYQFIQSSSYTQPTNCALYWLGTPNPQITIGWYGTGNTNPIMVQLTNFQGLINIFATPSNFGSLTPIVTVSPNTVSEPSGTLTISGQGLTAGGYVQVWLLRNLACSSGDQCFSGWQPITIPPIPSLPWPGMPDPQYPAAFNGLLAIGQVYNDGSFQGTFVPGAVMYSSSGYTYCALPTGTSFAIAMRDISSASQSNVATFNIIGPSNTGAGVAGSQACNTSQQVWTQTSPIPTITTTAQLAATTSLTYTQTTSSTIQTTSTQTSNGLTKTGSSTSTQIVTSTATSIITLPPQPCLTCNLTQNPLQLLVGIVMSVFGSILAAAPLLLRH